MGTRIHKKMGWLLETTKPLNLEILEDLTLARLKQEQSENEEVLMELQMENGEDSTSLSDFVAEVSDTENSRRKKFVYLFTPPFMKEAWSRYDDAIDYQEAVETSVEAKLTITYCQRSLFPFSKPLVVVTTKQALSARLSEICRFMGNLSMRNRPELQAELQAAGIDPNQPIAPQVYSQAPASVWALAQKLGVQNLNDLRPAIVSYWS